MLSLIFLLIIGFTIILSNTNNKEIIQRIKNNSLFTEYRKIEELIIRSISKMIWINTSLNRFLILFRSCILVNISPVVLDLITFKGRLIM